MAAAGSHETGCGALGAEPVIKEWGEFPRKLFHRNAFPDPVHVRDEIRKPLELQVEDLALLAGMRVEHHHLTSPVSVRLRMSGMRGAVCRQRLVRLKTGHLTADALHDVRTIARPAASLA